MNWQEVLKKYGAWIAAGALVLYLVLKNKGGVSRAVIPGAQGGADFAAQTERLRQTGALDLERAKLEANLEAQRLRAANDRFNLEQQALARRRALDLAQRGQTTGLINQLLKNLESILRGGKTGSTGGGEGRSLPSTPNTFPGRPSLPPAYPVPQPNIPGLFNPPFTPAYPQISDYPLSVTDWGEAPQFGSAGLDIDTGASFYDLYSSYSPESYYGGYSDSPITDAFSTWGEFGFGSGFDSYSAYPEYNYGYGDTGSYLSSGGDDFYYGYGASESYDSGDSGGGDYGFGSDE